MLEDKFKRTIGLIGMDSFLKLQEKKIYIAGLGGVGGTTLEALVRMGFKNFIIVDRDEVEISNLNRQILYVEKDIGKAKVEAAKERILSINSDINVLTYKEDVLNCLPTSDVDIVVDCIDDIKAKVSLIKSASEQDIPLISSMGMANKMDPSKIKISTINKSTVDPLAKKLRYELKKAEIDYTNVMCVYSDETPFKDGNNLNSLISVTSTAGLYIANYIFNLLNKN